MRSPIETGDRKLRIALVIERMDVARGGRERSTGQVACGLARRGHEVTVLCQQGSWRARGVRVEELGRRGLLRVCRLKSFVADVQQRVRRGDVDIVHAMLPVPGANVYQPRGGTVPAQRAASVRRRRGFAALLAELAEPCNLHRQHMGRLEREVVGDPRVLCLPVSRMVAEELKRYYGRSERVRVIYNGVDVPDADPPLRDEWRRRRRRELGVDDSAVVFLTVATNFELKGVAESISGFARWRASAGRRTDARLVVAGDGNRETYQQWAGGQSVADKVEFIGPTDEVFQWYAAADAVVLLSWYDPCSRVVLEATRWGLPSITTAQNGAAEVLHEGAGVVVGSPRDTAAVAAAMAELADPQTRAARVEACRRTAMDLTIDRHVDELLDAYAALAAGR